MRTPALASFLALVLTAPALAQDVLVVAPKDLQSAAADWKAYREEQGLSVAFRDPAAADADVAAILREAHEKSGRKLRFVMLLGDADKVPCSMHARAGNAIMGMDGAEPQIATDALWGDLDGDGVPEIAVGRVPADSPADAKAYLARVVAYETSRDFGAWRSKLNVVAGTGGFGPFVDMALEKLCRDLLAECVPPAVEVSMTYANPLSPFCPPPSQFADTAVRRWSEGALVVAYVGHGSERAVDRVRSGKDQYAILDLDHVAKIAAANGAPVSMFVACSTGHFDGPADCLAEELLRRPKGPVAVIASSRVSSPYSNGIVAKVMLDALYRSEAPTTGELLTAIKRRLVASPAGDKRREQIDLLAAQMFEPDADKRRGDREDHLYLYNLLGDPCVRIGRPGKLEVDAPATIAPGATLTVFIRSPFSGKATIVIERARKVPVKPSLPVKKTDDDYRQVYEAANAREVLRAEVDLTTEGASFSLPIPADAAPGACAIRVHVAGEKGGGAGGREIEIAAPPAPQTPK